MNWVEIPAKFEYDNGIRQLVSQDRYYGWKVVIIDDEKPTGEYVEMFIEIPCSCPATNNHNYRSAYHKKIPTDKENLVMMCSECGRAAVKVTGWKTMLNMKLYIAKDTYNQVKN